MDWLLAGVVITVTGFACAIFGSFYPCPAIKSKQQKRIDELIAERDNLDKQANDYATKFLQQSNENGLLESRCTELQRIIDDYRRWMRESVKLMPDSVKHATEIRLVEVHRPRPAEVKA